MSNVNTYDTNPRGYAIELIDLMGGDMRDKILQACLGYMSHDDVRDMLDANELSPRFDEDED